MADPRGTEARRFFDDPLRARTFVIGLSVFYAGIAVACVASGAGHPAVAVIASVPALGFGGMAIFSLPSRLMWWWSWGALRERCALVSQLREAADVAGWHRRAVLTTVLGLLAVDVAALVLLWAVTH